MATPGELWKLVRRTFLFTLVAPGSLTVLVPYGLLRSARGTHALELTASGLAGLLPLGVGVGIYCWCAYDFVVSGRGTPDPWAAPRALVSRGLYRFVRNPMYVGVVSIVLGEAVLFGAGVLVLYAAILLMGFHVRVLLYEEPTLRRLFGSAYDAYCAEVPRWLPRFSAAASRPES